MVWHHHSVNDDGVRSGNVHFLLHSNNPYKSVVQYYGAQLPSAHRNTRESTRECFVDMIVYQWVPVHENCLIAGDQILKLEWFGNETTLYLQDGWGNANQ